MKRSPFAHALNFSLIPVALAIADMGNQAFGQAISLYTPTQSVIEAIATFDGGAGVTTDGNVNSLPYLTVTTATDSTATSSVGPTLSTSSLSFAFSSSVADKPSTVSGEGTIFFTALVNATYSISGNLTASGAGKTGAELSAFLKDTGTSTYLYQYDLTQGGAFGSTSATLDNSIEGSLTGTLLAGEVYEFDAFDASEPEAAQTLSGTTTISFLVPTPEPSTWALMLAGVGLLAGFNIARKSKSSARV